MIAENYRTKKVHFAENRIGPVSFRFRCILLDQDTEYPPFEPCRFFVVNVFAETKEQVLDCVCDKYPWCDVMVIDKAYGVTSDDEYLASWIDFHDTIEQKPVKEAPHGEKRKANI